MKIKALFKKCIFQRLYLFTMRSDFYVDLAKSGVRVFVEYHKHDGWHCRILSKSDNVNEYDVIAFFPIDPDMDKIRLANIVNDVLFNLGYYKTECAIETKW